jgi:glucokinase
MPVIALDLGGTKLAGAIFSNEGDLLHKAITNLDKRKGAEVGTLILDMISTLRVIANDRKIPISSIGMCVPGIAYRNGNVWAPNIEGWENYPLRKELESSLKTSVHIDSDRSCYILGESWKGNAQGCKHAIFLSVGTGIGAGILINNEILRGAHDIAGAIGWMALNKPFDGKYVQCGCFEYNASGEGIGKVADDILSAGNKNSILSPGTVTAQKVMEAFDQDDAIAKEVIASSIEYWGMAVANLVSLFNPEKIIFGGGVFGPALRFLNEIHIEAKKWAQPISIQQVQLVGSALGNEAGLYGAGKLALMEVIKPINV